MSAIPIPIFERRKPAVMLTPAERARKTLAMVLTKLSDSTQTAVAAAMGTSDSSLSRMKNPPEGAGSSEIERVLLLAHLGLKVVEGTQHCIPRERYEFLVQTHMRVVEKAPHLVWGDDE